MCYKKLIFFNLILKQKVYLEFEKNGLTFITNNINGNFSLYNSSGNFLGTFNINDKNENRINLIEFIMETGLQVKADPGIPLIFLGFLV